jgi:epoxyqueuosine reductase
MEKNNKMIDKQQLKDFVLAAGADLVGIGNLTDFEGAEPGRDPRFIAPQAKSIIGLGFRVLRGSLRGNEEGTQFYQYPEMGVVHLDEVYIPMVLRKIACYLEDKGYEGVVLRSEPDRMHASDPGTNPEHTPVYRMSAVSVREGAPPPDVIIDNNQAAVICGLGEMGFGGFVLTPEFGPLQRFAFILTDAELEFDEVMDACLCDSCGLCFEACPGSAYKGQNEQKLVVGKNTYYFKLPESWQCAAYYMGANGEKNPFLDPEKIRRLPDGEKILKGNKQLSPDEVLQLKPILEQAYPGMRFGYNAAICGRACWRACLVHLEEKKLLKTNFNLPFRKREEWKLSL